MCFMEGVGMRKMIFGITVCMIAWMAAPCLPPYPAGHIGIAVAQAEEEFRYHDERIRYHFTQERNLVHFNMLQGMLVDLLREHNKFFVAKGRGENTVDPKVEDLLNDAGLSGSQGKYDEGFATLKIAYDLLKDSLTELGIEADK